MKRYLLLLLLCTQCEWNIYDAADATAPDGGGFTGTYCGPSTQCGTPNCCIPGGGGPPDCQDASTCTGTYVTCSHDSNCAPGEVCCIEPSDAGKKPEYVIACVASSACTGQIACNDNNDCSGCSANNGGGQCRANIGACNGPTPACNPP